MSLGSTTFETLKERAQGKIQKVLERNGLESLDDLSSLTSRDRNRIRDLERYLGELEEFASPSSQKRAYDQVHGRDAWEGSFERVGDLHYHPATGKRDKHLRKLVWDAVPNSPWKRFQEVFSHPDDYVVPKFNIRDGKVEFAPEIDFRTMSLLPCLISGDRIPEKLAEDLGLCDFSELRGFPRAPEKRLLEKAKLGTLLHLKRVFQNTTPVEDRQYRILRIHEPPNGSSPHYPPETKGPGKHLVGRLLITAETYDQQDALDHWPRQLRVEFHSSPGSAYRRTVHIAREYRKETPELADLQARLTSLATLFRLGFTRDALESVKTKLLEDARPVIQEGLTLLRSPVHRTKVEAKEFLLKLDQDGGTIDRRNALGIVLQLEATITRLAGRVGEIPRRNQYIQRDSNVLHGVIAYSDSTLLDYGRKIEAACTAFERPGGIPFFYRRKDSSTGREAAALIDQLGLDPGLLEATLPLQPYRTFAGKIREKFDKFQGYVMAQKKSQAVDALVELHVIMKFHKVYMAFQKMKTEIAFSPRVTLEGLHEQAKELCTAFEAHQVFPRRKARGYQEAFESIRERVKTVRDGLGARIREISRLRSDDARATRRKEVKEGFDRFLDEFSVEEELAKVF